MKIFKDKVAVITGGANGFGLEFAKEALQRGMKVVIGDCDVHALDHAKSVLDDFAGEYLAVTMDVTVFDDMQRLADETLAAFGQVDLFFNNAGVAVFGQVWDLPLNDIDYVIQSNLYGVAYGLKVFVPIMDAQGTECHIVNTASIAGHVVSSGMPTYFMTKFGNVALTESSYYRLQEMGSKVKMSVYCPGFVQTDLHNCQAKRPARFAIDQTDPYYSSPTYAKGLQVAKHLIETGIPIDSVAMMVFQAIEEEKFYIMTHPQYTPLIGLRAKTIMDNKNPDVALFKR